MKKLISLLLFLLNNPAAAQIRNFNAARKLILLK